ncbi:chemotaxis protein CheD [Andreprevotia chitinilytica]|uniref:chemotaxis protein CheD n=1 Tax=Andreprevotia chitinilytica TaxID=396808 RepID=UPI00054F9082|nr:chemotaxis protein CheD [Andreprevotia chitinilytica]
MSRRIFINPGGIFFGNGDVRVETLLGSCVAITLWHPERKFGGLCHFLLPSRITNLHLASERDGRYGEEALLQLTAEARQRGTELSEYTIKLFGGSRVFDSEPRKTSIGEANAHFALDMLKHLGLPVARQDLTGYGYRYLRFDLSNGDVWVRRGRGVSTSQRVPEPQ